MKSERMKTELLTNVSHDIKTPLTAIVSYVDLLKQEPMPNEKAKEYLGRTGPPVRPPEKADGGLSGSLQSHHRQPDRGPPAHGCERLPGPDHRGI